MLFTYYTPPHVDCAHLLLESPHLVQHPTLLMQGTIPRCIKTLQVFLFLDMRLLTSVMMPSQVVLPSKHSLFPGFILMEMLLNALIECLPCLPARRALKTQLVLDLHLSYYRPSLSSTGASLGKRLSMLCPIPFPPLHSSPGCLLLMGLRMLFPIPCPP